MWCPPTPPTTDNDVYIDYSLGFLYENTPMSEAQLPPIYVKKEQKRSRTDTGMNERDGKNIDIYCLSSCPRPRPRTPPFLENVSCKRVTSKGKDC